MNFLKAQNLKRLRTGKPYVEPPHRTWAYKFLHTDDDFKLAGTDILDIPRHLASTKGNTKDWYDRIEAEINPTM